jgi:sulfopropanediol 3-dehydrogenase
MARYLKRANAKQSGARNDVAETVRSILDDVQRDGDDAVARYARRFDRWEGDSFRVDEHAMRAAERQLPETFKDDFAYCLRQVRAFAERQRASVRGFEVELEPGVTLGQRVIPLARVGCYIPGGKYPLISSAIMSIATAKVAGVDHVVACAPPKGDGEIYPHTLYAMHHSGANAIYALGGVQAMAATAHGCLGIEPVDLIVGAGNPYVAEAKRQLFGVCGIDLLAGPTEIGIIADETADPFVVACDLVGQAEHDPYSRAVLITTSRELGQAVLEQMDDHLTAVGTEDVARASWENGGEIIVVADEEELVRVCDDYAIEHVEVLVAEPKRMLDRLRHYGSMFIGEQTTVAYGDKVSGPNHVLPTLRAARFTGGLWVGKYLKTVTFQHMDEDASVEMARHCEVESLAEGMEAHARTATIRLERYAEQAGSRAASAASPTS